MLEFRWRELDPAEKPAEGVIFNEKSRQVLQARSVADEPYKSIRPFSEWADVKLPTSH